MERQFKGVWITAAVWLNTELTAVEKMLYSEIDSFTGNGRTFFKANETIASDMGVSVSTIKRSLSKLIKQNMIEQISYDGRTRHLQSREPSVSSNCDHPKVQIEPSVGSNRVDQLGQKEPIKTKTKNTLESTNELQVPESFDSNDFREAWMTWKMYKSEEHRFKYKSKISEQTTIHKLHNDTGGDPRLAILAIGNSIASGWKGIYPKESDSSERHQPIDRNRTLEWADS